jgi:tRNA A37 threonylcarbamoyladenosine dehydratase
LHHVHGERRFGGIERLYGGAAQAAFARAEVVVVGLGGVGSWAAEALVRSGIGALRLIDLDHVAESNINRQLPALDSTLGRAKVAVLAERFLDINPKCRIEPVEAFVEADDPGCWLGEDPAMVIDCIDSVRVKAALIAHCRQQRIRLIAVGGAGGRRDPTRIQVSDLARSKGDPLLAKTRRLLRADYGFSANPKRRFEVKSVWSDEAPVWPSEQCNASGGSVASRLQCGGLGSSVAVTATMGMVAVAQGLELLSRETAASRNHPAAPA